MKEDDFLRVIGTKVLADEWGTLTQYKIAYRRRDGTWQDQVREAYDRGHGVTCLLHNPETNCVLLTRQFRLPVWAGGEDPFLIETPAGLLEGAQPEERMRAELIEETGFEISELHHLFDVYMSPGSVTEYLSFFSGSYTMKNQVAEGGGAADEGEEIEVLHIPIEDALRMIRTGQIRDAKTILLLQELALRGRTES